MIQVTAGGLVGIPNLQTEEAAPNIGNRGDDVETGMWSHGNEATRSWFSSNYSKCLNIACCLRQGNELSTQSNSQWSCVRSFLVTN